MKNAVREIAIGKKKITQSQLLGATKIFGYSKIWHILIKLYVTGAHK